MREARKLAVAVAKLAADTRCNRVSVLQVTELSALADFFVLADGTSPRQMRSVLQDIEELADAMGVKTAHRSGVDGESWMVCDFGDVVVHLFNPDARLYYDLDGLWADAPSLDWRACDSPG